MGGISIEPCRASTSEGVHGQGSGRGRRRDHCIEQRAAPLRLLLGPGENKDREKIEGMYGPPVKVYEMTLFGGVSLHKGVGAVIMDRLEVFGLHCEPDDI